MEPRYGSLPMNTYTTHGTVIRTKDGAKSTYTETYEQPFWRHAIASLYHFYDMRIFKMPGFKKVEAFDQWLHDRRCNDDCMTGYVSRRGQPAALETYCAHMPLSARQDLRCFDLRHKKRRVIERDDSGYATVDPDQDASPLP